MKNPRVTAMRQRNIALGLVRVELLAFRDDVPALQKLATTLKQAHMAQIEAQPVSGYPCSHQTPKASI